MPRPLGGLLRPRVELRSIMRARLGIGMFAAQYRQYWRARARLSDLRLQILQKRFNIRSWASNERESSSAILTIARLTALDLTWGVSAAGVLWLTAPYSGWLSLSIDKGASIELLGTIAGIGGVFIGLYYTAITAAMTAVYSKMPGAVRQLLLEERFGNAYMRFVATTTFLSLVLLGICSAGLSLPPLAIPTIGLMVGVAVFGFVQLGTWAFRLFDPTAVGHVIFRDLDSLLTQVSAGGYQWRDGAFQRFSQRRAATSLRTMKELALVCRDSEHLRDEGLTDLAIDSLRLGERSVIVKPAIPSASLWFPETHKQPDWYRSDDSQIGIAHQTGTPLQPQSSRDSWWVETRCHDLAQLALVSLLSRRRDALASRLLAAFESSVGTLAGHGHVAEAVKLAVSVRDSVMDSVLERTGADPTQEIARVALTDSVARLWVACLLSAANWADSVNKEAVARTVEDCIWDDPRTPYSLGLRSHAVGRAEWLFERLDFERSMLGHVITPSWYLAELISQTDAEAVATATTELFTTIPEQIDAGLARIKKHSAIWPLSCDLSNALHYHRKAQVHLDRLEAAAARLDSGRLIAKLTWPSSDAAKRADNLTVSFAGVVEGMAALLPHLPARPDGIPDYPGQFLHTCTEEVFDLLLAGDDKRLAVVFPSVFIGCLAKHDALKAGNLSPQDPWLEAAISVSLAPILDLVELSGYALLLSQAYPERATWPMVEKSWEAFFVEQSPFAAALAAMLQFSSHQFAITPRSMLRSTWHQRIDSRLKSLPRRPSRHSWMAGEVADHPSPLVRVIGRPDAILSSYTGADIFAACYLATTRRIPIGSLQRKAADLRSSMEMQEGSDVDDQGTPTGGPGA